MIRDHSGCIRSFHRSSKAWYAQQSVSGIEINFGMYDPDGGSSGEMTRLWEKLAGKMVPRLYCWDDGWNALGLFTDLIQELARRDNDNITEQQFADLLLYLGFKDLTQYENKRAAEQKAAEVEMITITLPRHLADKLKALDLL